MKKKICISASIVLILVIFSEWSTDKKNIPSQYHNKSFYLLNNFLYAEESDKLNPDPDSDAFKIYVNLKELYRKWNNGILKNRKVYRQLVRKHLSEIKDKDIHTDYDYFFIAPEAVYGKRIVCYFIFDHWLRIKGNIDLQVIAKMLGEKPEVLTKWWRARKLVSMRGRLGKFNLETDQNGEEIIVLHLEDFKIKGISDANTGENSK